MATSGGLSKPTFQRPIAASDDGVSEMFVNLNHLMQLSARKGFIQ
jgi:hypothetical protein